MKKYLKYIPVIILVLGVLFNLIIYYPETTTLLDPNDNVFQLALVKRTNKIWQDSHCPFSLSCLPNLIDHNVPNWAEGYPLPFYYSHLPQIAIVASFQLFVKLFMSLGMYYNWVKYLLLTTFPVPTFLAFIAIGINPLFASLAAIVSSHLSTDGLYGIDPPSYLWRGYGLTSQLYATYFFPLAVAFTFRSLKKCFPLSVKDTNIKSTEKKFETKSPILAFRRVVSKRSDSFWAILFITLTIGGHLGIGMILLLTLPIFLFVDLRPSHILARFKHFCFLVGAPLFLLSYWIIPAALFNKYHLISFWDPIWKFNSYGWIDASRQYLQGEIFDWKRFPAITVLITIGLYSYLTNKKYFPFAFSFIIWMLLYFGRTTWGGFIDIVPGMKDFHLSRFIVGVHISGLFLIAVGMQSIIETLRAFIAGCFRTARKYLKVSLNIPSITPDLLPRFSAALLGGCLIAILILITLKGSYDYNLLNNVWIPQSNSAFRYEEKNFNALIDALLQLAPGRVYAGRPGNWGREFRYSSTQMYMSASIMGFPISQFLPESWSPNSDNEEMFDERVREDYDLYNLRYIIAPQSFTAPKEAKLLNQFGPFLLYEMPTTGYFDVVSSNLMVQSKKTDYVNIVHVWQKSYARQWKMHPLIDLESRTPPPGIKTTIKMTDLANYEFNGREYNLFGSYPFSFPQATASGIVKDQTQDKPNAKEIYKANVSVPENCPNCFILFKMSYHPNWRVTLDGKPAENWSIFPFFMAVAASPGSHTIEYIYKPSNLKIFLGIIEIAGILAFIFRKKIRKIL